MAGTINFLVQTEDIYQQTKEPKTAGDDDNWLFQALLMKDAAV